MKIFKVNSIVGKETLTLLKKQMRLHLNRYAKSGALNNILEEFEMYDIQSAIDSIYLIGNHICIPDNTRDGYILRLLEYGGPKIKALNLMTRLGVRMGGSL